MWSNDPSPPCLPNYYQIKLPKSKRRFKEPCLKLWTNNFGQTDKHDQIWSLICIFKKIQISFPDNTDCIQDTLTIYIDSCTDTVLLYTTCSYELYFCVQNSYKQDAHTHTRTLHFIYYIDSCTDILLLLYTSCTDGLYFFVNCCTTWQYINIHLWCTHYAWISCTAVRLYCSPVSVRLYCQLVLTNESPRKITLMNRVDQSQLRFLGIALPP
jgi:hypothetical protein